jgi:hypothetical protein
MVCVASKGKIQTSKTRAREFIVEKKSAYTHHEVLGVQNLGGGDVMCEHLGGADGGDVGGNGLGLLGDV